MKNIFIFILLLFSGFVFSQSPGTPDIQFQSAFRITNAVNGTLDTVVISGYVDECAGRFTNSDIAIGDSIYVLEGSDLLVFGVVTTRTISLGVATFKAIDFGGAGILPSNGQAAIFRPTGNYQFPGYICGLNPNLQQYITARFMMRLDDILSNIGGSVVVGDSLDDIPLAAEILASDELIGKDSSITFQQVIGQTRDSLQVDTIIASNTAVLQSTMLGAVKNRKHIGFNLKLTSAESQDEAINLPSVADVAIGTRFTFSVRDSSVNYDYYLLPEDDLQLKIIDRYAERYYFDANEIAVFVVVQSGTEKYWRLESTTSDAFSFGQTVGNIRVAATDFTNKRFIRGSRVKNNLGAEYDIVNVPVSGYNSNNPDSVFVYQVKDKAPWGSNPIKNSEGFGGTNWTPLGGSGTGVTVFSTTEPAPDGTNTAVRVVRVSSNGMRSSAVSITSGQQYTFSVFLKTPIAASNDDMTMLVELNDHSAGAQTITPITSTKEWRRYSVTLTANATNANSFYDIAFAGTSDVGDSLLVWGMDHDPGSVVRDYKRTETTATVEGTLYAVYKSRSAYIEIDKVFQRKNDSRHIEAGCNYAVTQPQKEVLCEKNRTITETVDVPIGSGIVGTYTGGALGSDYTKQGTIFYLDLKNASLNAFEFPATANYEAGQFIKGVMMIPISSGRAAIKTNDGIFNKIEDVSIVNYLNSTRHLSYGVEVTAGSIQVTLNRVQVRNASVAGILYSGSTQMSMIDSEVMDCAVGMISAGDMYLENTWFEDLDSCAIIHNGANSRIEFNSVYTEGVPSSGGGGTANTFYFKAANTVTSTGGLVNGEGNDNILIRLENVKAATFIGSRFVNGSSAFENTSASGTLTLVGCTSDITWPGTSYTGIYDSTYVNVIGGNGSASNAALNNKIQRLETYDAYIGLSRVDSSYLNDNNITGELQLNAPTVTNRNENLIRSSEAVSPGANGWVGYVSASVPNDTIAPNGTLTADRVGYGAGNNLLRFTPNTVSFVQGQWYTISLWYANSEFDDIDISVGGIGGGNTVETITTPNSNEWVRKSVTIKNISANNYLDFNFNGVSGDSIHVWGFQVERNRYLGDYVQTTGTAKTNDLVNPSININEDDILEFDGDVALQGALIDSTGSSGTTGQVPTQSGTAWIWDDPAGGVSDHGGLTGLADDDHTQYALLAGRAGSQVLYGGTAANEDLTLDGTSNGTKASSYVVLQPTGGSVGIATTSPDRLFHTEVADAVTNAVTYAERQSHTTSGTAAIGLGVGTEYELENASGSNVIAAANEIVWTDPVNSTEDADIVIKAVRAGALTEAFRVISNGDARIQRTLRFGSAATAYPQIAPFTTSVGSPDIAGTNLMFYNNTTTGAATAGAVLYTGTGFSQTSGNAYFTRYQHNYGASSGNAIYSPFSIQYTINNGGAVTGSATGFLVNVTETSLNGMTNNLIDARVGTVSKFRVGNGGAVTFANSSQIYPYAGVFPSTPSGTGTNLSFFNYNTSATGMAAFAFSGSNLTPTSGTSTDVWAQRTFAPTSGTADYAAITVTPVINQTGGANGQTYGIVVDPVLTAAADFVGIDVRAGGVTVDGVLTSTGKLVTLGAAATTMAVNGNVVTVTGDAGGNTLATITGGKSGQILTLIFVDALVTITDDGSGTADTVNLSAGFTSTADDTITFVHDGTSWREIMRSVN